MLMLCMIRLGGNYVDITQVLKICWPLMYILSFINVYNIIFTGDKFCKPSSYKIFIHICGNFFVKLDIWAISIWRCRNNISYNVFIFTPDYLLYLFSDKNVSNLYTSSCHSFKTFFSMHFSNQIIPAYVANIATERYLYCCQLNGTLQLGTINTHLSSLS